MPLFASAVLHIMNNLLALFFLYKLKALYMPAHMKLVSQTYEIYTGAQK